MNLCIPAMLYLIIYIIIEIFKGFSVQFQIGAFVLNLIIMLVWVYLLNYLCSKGYTTFSWIIFLLPYIFIAIFLGYGFVSLEEIKSNLLYGIEPEVNF
jgi:hypothetical protein